MTLTLTETEYLEQLLAFDPDPDVDLDATWALTIAGARALGAEVDHEAFGPSLARWVPWRVHWRGDPGRWMEAPR